MSDKLREWIKEVIDETADSHLRCCDYLEKAMREAADFEEALENYEERLELLKWLPGEEEVRKMIAKTLAIMVQMRMGIIGKTGGAL